MNPVTYLSGSNRHNEQLRNVSPVEDSSSVKYFSPHAVKYVQLTVIFSSRVTGLIVAKELYISLRKVESL